MTDLPINNPLWEKINSFQLDDVNSKLTFSVRLARENGWSHIFALRAIDEYKKFLYLSVKYRKSLTPSDEVDQVWHLHMLYSDSYWLDLCRDTLGVRFTHGPTKGGSKEATKYNLQYEGTLDLYNSEFGSHPTDIWPSSEIRFSRVNFVRVNVDENFILSRTAIYKYAASFILIPTSIMAFLTLSSVSGKESKSDDIDWGFTFLLILGILFAWWFIRGLYRYATKDDRKRNSSSSGYSNSSDSGCTIGSSFFGCSGDSGCSSGSSGCGSSGCSSSGCGGGCGGGD